MGAHGSEALGQVLADDAQIDGLAAGGLHQQIVAPRQRRRSPGLGKFAGQLAALDHAIAEVVAVGALDRRGVRNRERYSDDDRQHLISP